MTCSLLAALICVANLTTAQDITWSGDGDSDNSGNWSDGDNWGGGILPSDADRVILPTVTSGTRTVTQDIAGGVEINALRFVQSGSDGVNRLSLDGNIALMKPTGETTSLTGTTSAMQWDLSGGATVEQAVIDLNGYSITIKHTISTSKIGAAFGGIINFNQPGSAIYGTSTGHTGLNVYGKLIATADGWMGRSHGGTQSTANVDLRIRAGAELKVMDGADFSVNKTGRVGLDKPTFTLTNYGLINVEEGATLSVIREPTGSSGGSPLTRVINAADGTMELAGKMRMRAQSAADSDTSSPINNNGLWIVDGEQVSIERLTTGRYTAVICMPVFNNGATGTLRGNSWEDCLEFDEEVADGTRRMPIFNSGKIAPGAGSAAEDLASVGLLTLRDIDLVMEETGVIELDIGGAKEAEMDRLVLAKGLNDPADDAGTLDLTEGGTLQLVTANDYDHLTSFRRPVITAGSVTGEFETVKLDGETFTDNELEFANGVRYEVVYEADAVWLYCFGIDNQTTILIY